MFEYAWLVLSWFIFEAYLESFQIKYYVFPLSLIWGPMGPLPSKM